MVIYISSDKGSILERSSLVIKRYDRWKCDIQKFIKEEYVNISSTDCEMIVIDVDAVEKAEEILHFKNAFKKSVIVMLIPEDYRGIYPEGIDIIIKDESIDKKLLKLLNPKNPEQSDITKIGIWSDNDELSIQFAISLLSFFYKKIDDICLVEISDKFILEKNLKQYKLTDKEGVKYKNIPIVHNAMIDNCRIGVFTFIKSDSKRLFDMCDIPIEVISDRRIKVVNKSYNVFHSSRNYFKKNNAVFNKIFQGYLTKQKSSKINLLQTIKEQRRKILFAASIILIILITSIVLLTTLRRDKSYIQETTSKKVIILETTTESKITTPQETTAQEITVQETVKSKKKNPKEINNGETQSVVSKQMETYYKPKERIIEKITIKQTESKKPYKKQPKEKIEGNSSTREKIENYDAEKVE
jgi:hypothetical protein